MPYLPTVPPEEAAGEVKAMYDKDLAAQGYVANYTRAFSRRPEVLQRWLALKNAITSGAQPIAGGPQARCSYPPPPQVHAGLLAEVTPRGLALPWRRPSVSPCSCGRRSG